MPSSPRILFREYPVLITTRVEEGLPFVCNEVIELIIKCTLAKAQELYQVVICHFIVLGNHIHLLVIVQAPDDIAAFMNYFKMETAHAINKLRGRRQRTVWGEGYDAVSILTPGDTIEKIAYIYTNPQKAHLVERIEDYPGVSSWKMYTENNLSIVVPRITRPSIYPSCSVESLTEDSFEKTVEFRLSPNAWMPLFGIQEPDAIDGKIQTRIRVLEADHAAVRAKNSTKVLGAQRLRTQSIDKPYVPSKFAKRMWCISKDLELRRNFINTVKGLIDSTKRVYSLWKQGHTQERYPPGMFPPRFPRLVNRYAAVSASF